VTCSTEQDRLKLKRVLEFLKGTLEDYRIVGADDVTIMQTWVDASHAVHKDMKSHTGGVVSFGRGAVMSKSSKQKLNTKSSTESELVGASDYLAYPTWAKKFLGSQGYVLKQNIFHQDNKSTIKFEENGRKSCGPNSRHIDIRYFWIKDRLGLEDFEVRYCPTEQMLADFFTKPLQGGLFKKLRAVVMGHMHIDSLRAETSPPTQERVGEQGKDQKKTVRIKVSAGNVSEGADDVPGAKTDAKTQQPFTLIGKKGKPIVRTTNCRKRERRLNSSHSIRIIPS
jgi:KUP system potassium uptake protein